MSSGEGSLSRAERIRARRLDRREGKPTIGRAMLGRPAQSRTLEIPRMVARNPQMERKLAATSGKEARRWHVLKLADRGAELRLPSLPSVRVGWRVISGSIVATCLFMLYSMYASTSFTVNRVEVRGAQRLDANAVNSALEVAGGWIFDVQPADLSLILHDQFPELESASISVGLPARVVVDVQERLPLIAWEQAGLTVWVDAAGVAFIPQESAEQLIQVSALEAPPELAGDGYERHQLIKPEMVIAIQALSAYAPENSVLMYDPKMGFGWSDPGGWLAFFGQDGKEMDQRIAVYQTIVNELAARRLTPTLISVAQLHAPYYRMDY